MTPDIREKAERLAAAHRNYANDRDGFADLISQALLEAHNAGRAEMKEEAAKLADKKKRDHQRRVKRLQALTAPGMAESAIFHDGYATGWEEAATAIRSIT